MIIVTVILTILIGLAGVAKLAGTKQLAEQFQEFGLPIPFMYVVGVLEVAAAMGLWVAPFKFWAAAGVTLLMLGAIGNHVKAKHPISQTAPSIVVMILAAITAFLLLG